MSGSPFEKNSLSDVSLDVAEGEFLGIIGHTGSGKSTLIQQFNGLLRPTSGSVKIFSRDIFARGAVPAAVRFEVGMVFQYPEYQLFEETVYKDIAFGPSNMKLDEDEIKKRVYEAAEIVGISEKLLEKSPFELSGGQKRRAAIAGVLAMKPKILVLDEPTAGLDPGARNSILRRIAKLHSGGGITVIIVSHSMEDIARLTQRIVILNKGRIFYDGAPCEVFRREAEIEAIGLSVPQVCKVLRKLREHGLDVDLGACTVEAAAETILKCLRKGK